MSREQSPWLDGCSELKATRGRGWTCRTFRTFEMKMANVSVPMSRGQNTLRIPHFILQNRQQCCLTAWEACSCLLRELSNRRETGRPMGCGQVQVNKVGVAVSGQDWAGRTRGWLLDRG